MVALKYRIECKCGQWQTKVTQSGAPDKWLQDYKCSHFTVGIHQQTTLGWIFGVNAQVKFCFYPKCNSCGHTFDSWSQHAGGNSFSWWQGKKYHCCNQSITISMFDLQCSWSNQSKENATRHYYGPGSTSITSTNIFSLISLTYR